MFAQAAETLLGHFAWYDISAASTNDNASLLGVDYAHLLEANVIDTTNVSNCSKWVAQALCDVSALRCWKLEAQKRKTLSVIEVANRGSAILISLKANMSDRILSGAAREFECDLSVIFARATIIYLHTIMSGPNPRLEEIQHEVVGLTRHFRALAVDGLSGYASWPFCVTARFAEEQQMEELLESLEVDSRHAVQRNTAKACHEALLIAKECRRIREVESKDCDWTVAIAGLRRPILLV
jgi:C6 transcription factor Pro1